jgi:single-strand DNA-binding protein
MSNSLNRCEFIGNLGKDPDIRYSASGDAIANFSIAVGWKTKDKEGTEWVRVTAFGKLAGICGEYLRKGSQVYIAGRMTTRKWQNKDGVDQYTTEVVADQMQMLGGKPEPSEPKEAPKPDAYRQIKEGGAVDMDDDIPFAPLGGRKAYVI